MPGKALAHRKTDAKAGPDWIGTPPEAEVAREAGEETDYLLLMIDSWDTRQSIPITRNQFIALKEHLAKLLEEDFA